MNIHDKRIFLENAIELINNLEEKTDKFHEIQIGWLEDNGYDFPITLMVNHPNNYFGNFEQRGWNTDVLMNRLGLLTLMNKPYLILNDLIDEVYD